MKKKKKKKKRPDTLNRANIKYHYIYKNKRELR